MRYCIGYAPTGPIVEYRKKLTADLAERFGIMDLSLRVPAHITVIYPIEHVDADREQITARIKSFVVGKQAIPVTIEGFGVLTHTSGTVYLAPKAEPRLQTFIKEAISTFADPADYTKFGGEFRPHISVARHLTPEQTTAIAAYVNSLPTPHFDLTFDSLSLFEFTDVWRIVSTHQFA